MPLKTPGLVAGEDKGSEGKGKGEVTEEDHAQHGRRKLIAVAVAQEHCRLDVSIQLKTPAEYSFAS